MFQNPGFKSLPEEIQANAKDHMIATEMFIFDLAKKNPLFQQKVSSELDLFPMFYFDETMIAGAMPPASAPASAQPQATGASPGQPNSAIEPQELAAVPPGQQAEVTQ
jgi:hypothetical protein